MAAFRGPEQCRSENTLNLALRRLGYQPNEMTAQGFRAMAVVERAVCCPFLVLLLTGLIDLGQGLADRLMIQKAANLGLEIVQASPPQIEAGDADYDYQHVRREAAAAAKVPIKNVRMSRWLECNGVRQPIDAICLVGQKSARFLSIEIRKIYQPQFVPKTYNLVVSAAVRIQ